MKDIAIYCDRESFQFWTEGILFERDSGGACVVGDNAEFEQAEKYLDEGKKIGLTVKGELKTIMQLKDGVYKEEFVD